MIDIEFFSNKISWKNKIKIGLLIEKIVIFSMVIENDPKDPNQIKSTSSIDDLFIILIKLNIL